MFIGTWPDYAFDPHGDNPDNDIKNELHVIEDKRCPWIIPDAAPFKKGSVKIRTPEGYEIRTGWKEVLEPTPLVELTGLPLATFIELSDELLAEYPEYVIDYHTVGIEYVPRSTLKEQLEAIAHGNKKIPWSKVIAIPATLPSSYHWHSVDELMDWTDLVLYVRYITGMYLRRSNRTVTIEDIYAQIAEVMENLIAQYNLTAAKLSDHEFNYANPHEVTAFDLLLGNVANYHTATIQEDIDGVRNDLHSTPAGAIAAVQAANIAGLDTSSLMRNGVMPISFLSSGDYLPPIIDGSFEGLGSDNNIAGVCLEASGRLMLIKRHFDGRVRGLYFSYCNDYKAKDADFVYTGARYSNERLSALGVDLDTVMKGSGNDVLCVGDSTAGKWYVTETNGTFNPKTHNFTEVNLSGISAIKFTPVRAGATAFLTKNYVVFAVPDDSSTNNHVSFWRIPRSSLGSTTPVTPTRFNVTFSDLHGTVYNNSTFWTPDTPVISGGRYTRYLHNMSGSATTIVWQYADPMVIVWESEDTVVFRQLLRPYYYNNAGGVAVGIYSDFNIAYRLNVSTGAMEFINATTPLTLDMNAGLVEGFRSSLFVNNSVGADYVGGLTMLPTGDYIHVGSPNNSTEMPPYLGTMLMNRSNAATAIRDVLSNTNLISQGGDFWFSNIAIQSALKSNYLQSLPAWDVEGEFFPCYAQNGKDRITAYRKVSGAFAVRPGVTNMSLPTVYSRPLTNEVYESNIGYNHPMLSISGTPAELTAVDVECGVSSFSALDVTKIDGEWALMMPESQGIDYKRGTTFMCIKSSRKVYNDDLMTMQVIPESYYGFTEATLQAILNVCPVDARSSTYLALRVVVPYELARQSNLATGLPCFAEVVWYSETNKANMGCSLVAFRMTEGAPSGDLTLLTAPTAAVIGPTLISGVQGLTRDINIPSYGGACATLSVYKNGNNFQLGTHTGWNIMMPGGHNAYVVRTVYNSTTHTFSSSSVVVAGYNRALTPALIPGVGFGSFSDASVTGESCTIAQAANNNYYMLTSAYPESGWILYFRPGATLVINGTEYPAPEGIVDLRDIEPDPTNKTFYVYATCYGDEAFYIVSAKPIRHNLSLIPAAKLTTGGTQILTIERYNTFIIGDGIVSTDRKAGSIPASTGLPMDEGLFRYVLQSDLPTNE